MTTVRVRDNILCRGEPVSPLFLKCYFQPIYSVHFTLMQNEPKDQENKNWLSFRQLSSQYCPILHLYSFFLITKLPLQHLVEFGFAFTRLKKAIVCFFWIWCYPAMFHNLPCHPNPVLSCQCSVLSYPRRRVSTPCKSSFDNELNSASKNMVRQARLYETP